MDGWPLHMRRRKWAEASNRFLFGERVVTEDEVMKTTVFRFLRAAIVAGIACLSTTARAEVFEWADGAVVDVGCQGAGDNNSNYNYHTMRFLGSGTIHGTYTPAENNPWSWAIWRNYLITNGTVVVDATDVKNFAPLFQRSVILGQTGALVISNATSTTLGCTTANRYPVYDVPDISFVTAAGVAYTGTVNLISCTIKGYPQSGIAAPRIDAGHTVAIAGPDFMNVYGTAFTNKTVYIFDDAFIPAGKTLDVGSGCACYLASYAIDPDLSDLLQTDKDHETKPWSALGEYAVSTHPISVGGTLTLESTAGCTFSALVSGRSMTSAVNLPGALTHTFAELGGTLKFGRTTNMTATVVVNAVSAGTKLFQGAGVTFQLPAGRTPVEIPVSGGTWYVFADADGSYNFNGLELAQATASATLPADTTFPEPAKFGTLKVAAGAGTTVSARVDTVSAPQFVGGAGTLKLAESVCNRALLWIDPSDDSLFRKLGTAIPNYIRAKAAGKVILTTATSGNDLVEALADTRSLQATNCLRQTRHYDGLMAGSKTDYEDLPQVFPFRVKNGLNGLSYFSCDSVGSSRRIPTSRGSLDTASPTPPFSQTLTGTKFVTMVFGSQNGGGKALVGLADGALTRSAFTKDAPIAPIAIDTWVDGVKVNPTTTGLSGGWQIISLDITGHNINGFGWASNYNTCGGQNFGEILVFNEVLADAERVSVETYLAKKWGLTGQYQGVATRTEHPAKAFLYGGTGNVEIDGHVQLSGTYSGSITVNAGGTFAVAPKYAPEIPSEGRVGWFDPDAADALHTSTEDGAPTVYGFWPRGKTESTMAVGDLFFYGVGSRRPFAQAQARGFGRTRTWIDFDHPAGHVPSDSDGNTFRIKAWTANGLADAAFLSGTSDRQLDVQTVLFATDSFRGGGDPLRNNVSSGGDFGTRGRAAHTAPIWSNAGTAVTKGATRLNGKAVDGTTSGYTGGAEVLSVVATNTVKLGNLGRYENSERVSGYAEMLGEILMYSTELTSEQVKTIEDYLLFKWLGIAPDGYGDFTGATVSGAGDVVVAAWSDLPQLAETFTGKVILTGGSLAFTFDMALESPVTNPIGAEGLSLALQDEVAVTVDFASKPNKGSYKLAYGSLVNANTRFTFSVTGMTGGSTIKLRAAADGLWLDVSKSGTLIIFH